MKITLLALLLTFFSYRAMAAACGANCTVNADCTELCKMCDTGPPGGACITCCDNPSQEDCDLQSPCVWESGECRNVTGWSCGSGVPEISEEAPKSIWLILGVLITLVIPSLLIWKNQRAKARKPL